MKKNALSASISAQLLCVTVPVLIFCLLGANKSAENGYSLPFYAYILIILLGGGTCLLFCNVLKKRMPVNIKTVFSVGIVCVLSLILRIPQWNTVCRGDGVLYFIDLISACNKFQFSFPYFIQNFQLANHPTYSYTIFASIIEFLFPSSVNVPWLLHFLLLIPLIYSVYDILIWCGFTGIRAFWGTLLVVNNPMQLGLHATLQPDFALAVFFPLCVDCYLRKRWILFVWSAILLTYTKEFGITLLTGMFIVLVLCEFFQTSGTLTDRLKALIKMRPLQIFAVAGLACGLSVIYCVWGGVTGWISKYTGGNANIVFGEFRFDLYHIIFKIGGWALCNGVWLLWLILLITILTDFKTFFTSRSGFLVLTMMGGLVIYALPYLAFKSSSLPRYDIVVQMCAFLIGACCLLRLSNKILCSVGISTVLLLGVFQAYLTIDPLMKKFYSVLDTGGVTMADTRYIGKGELLYGHWYIGDWKVYNNQYTVNDRAYQKLFELCEYDENTTIVSIDPFYSEMCITGMTGNGFYNWDPVKKNIVMANATNSIDILQREAELGNLEQGRTTNREIYLIFPYFGIDLDELEKEMADIYSNIETGTISVGFMGKARYYICTV